MPELVTLGETCAVLVAETRGPMRYAPRFERRIGGAESTVAAGVARLGVSAGWISRLGCDEFGEYVLGMMRAEKVDVSRVVMTDAAPTGVFFRENRTSGASAVFYYRSHSAFAGFGSRDLDPDYIKGARCLHVTGITPALSATCADAVEEAVAIARSNDVTVVFDVNYRAKIWPPEVALPRLEALMRRADHVLAGREDLAKLTGLTEPEAMLDYLDGLGLSNAVLKLGADGAVHCGAGRRQHVPGRPVANPVDRFGVGDAFAAGFVVGLLRERDAGGTVAAIELGNSVAAWSLGLPGNIESLPTWSDLADMQTGLNHAGR